MKELYVVGMPRSGSLFLNNVLTQLSERADFKVLNSGNGGTQHLTHDQCAGLSEDRQVIGIYRDLRDVVVSYYFYIYKLWTVRGEKHRLFNVCVDDEDGMPIYIQDALGRLKDHPDCLKRCADWLAGYHEKPWCTMLRFESFMGNQSETTRIIHEALGACGIDVNYTMVSEVVGENSIQQRSKQDPVHDQNGEIGKYKRFLTASQAISVETRFADYFGIGGYEQS